MGHIPVMLTEVLSGLAPRRGDTIVDCTFGGGGHSSAIAECIGAEGRIIAFDQDPKVREYAAPVLEKYPNIELVQKNFCNLTAVLNERGISNIDGIVFDLGISSFQIDRPERGFSWQQDCALDMRMNPDNSITAAQIVNTYGEKELADLIYNYGEERHSRRIARQICLTRNKHPINTSTELKNIISRSVSGSYSARNASISRVFQALRIAVNDELGILENSLRGAVEMLKSGGRLAVISFHSLEDRIVKNTFRDLKSELTILTKKPLTAGAEELKNNPRARSAKLRIGEKHG